MTVLVHLLLAWAYLLGFVLLLFILAAELRRLRARRARRAHKAVPYLPLERAQRAHPSNVRRIDSRVRVGGSR